jgi:methylenetetrahydrofolate reductase (NADPH)
VIGQLAAVRPEYFSITYGAGGSDQNGTYETLATVVRQQRRGGCAASDLRGLDARPRCEQLERYREAGVKRIVALRGDLPATAMSSSAPGDFHYANELVSFIRETHGDAFKIEVAAYPEMHPQAPNPGADFENFCRKVKAGADGGADPVVL